MNAVSIIILAAVAALVVLALRAAIRRDRGSCSCSACDHQGDCPYSSCKDGPPDGRCDINS